MNRMILLFSLILTLLLVSSCGSGEGPTTPYTGDQSGIHYGDGGPPPTSPPPNKRIIILSPVTGEELLSGTMYNILWESHGNLGNLRIEYSEDDFVSDIHEITPSTEDDDVFEWLVPDDPSLTVNIRITSLFHEKFYGVSEGYFTIINSEPEMPWQMF
ncbi:MAG: hypothetical protein ABIF08_00660, partial [Nanoarchaeota archaeon]